MSFPQRIMMAFAPNTKTLARWVADFFQTGVTFSPEHQDYLRTTHGDSDPALILQDVEDCEIDSVLQLIFYPDHSLHVRYEHDWGTMVWPAGAIDAVVTQFNRDPLQGRILLGPGRPPLWVALPPAFVRSWLERLRITWQPAPAITEALSHISDLQLRSQVRVHLRHAPLGWHGGQTALMVRFLKHMSVPSSTTVDTAVADLADLLSLLAAMPTDQPPETFLGERKTFFYQALRRAEDFEIRRGRQAMEVLMLQGCRAAFGSADHWRRQMAVVDRLSMILFGKIPDIAPPDCQTRVLGQPPFGANGA